MNKITRHYTYCAVCLKPLTPAEMKTTGQHDINSTCTAHNAYKNEFNLVQLRQRLSLPLDETALTQLHKKK